MGIYSELLSAQAHEPRRSSRLMAKPVVNYNEIVDVSKFEAVTTLALTGVQGSVQANDTDQESNTTGILSVGSPTTNSVLSSRASTPQSPLSPAPSWYNDDDLSCPFSPKHGFEEVERNNDKNGDGDKPAKRVRLDERQNAFSFHSEEYSKAFTLQMQNTGTLMNENDNHNAIEHKTAYPNTDDGASVLVQEAVPSASTNPSGELTLVSSTLKISGSDSLPPEIWSDFRGGLCEALPYFRAYKGSLYSQNCQAMGFLIDKQVDIRDVFSAQVVISSVGGGRVRDSVSGDMVRTADASDTAVNINAIVKAWADKSAIVVIAGENHPLYPCQPPHPYAVLDVFHITYVWKERQITAQDNEVKTWRIRFEKVDLQKQSWWKPHGHHGGVTPDTPSAPSAGCQFCGTISKKIFTSGWTCLNHLCGHYFVFPGSQNVIHPNSLIYTEAFLKERTPFVGQPPDLKPEMPNFAGSEYHGTESVSRRGFVCPDCGCCNRRLFWNSLVCENQSCEQQWKAHMNPYPQAILEQEVVRFDEMINLRRERSRVNVDVADKDKDLLACVLNRQCLNLSQDLTFASYKARQYYLPDAAGNIIGSFTLFTSNAKINSAENGPDKLFRELEVIDIGLKRNPAAIAGHKLEGLTRHFQQNFGARYKFGVSVQSKGFDEAPEAILRALHRLIWASQCAVRATAEKLAGQIPGKNTPPQESNEFNELLALGFMEDDSINYHDDGETELGPTVAALSLGSPSIMKFRPKYNKSGFGDTLPIGSRTGGGRAYKPVLEVPMKHGDMMVMHGAHIHRIYEHAVEPVGGRRFSLTSRYIDPNKMELQSDRDDAAVKGAVPAHAATYTYDGN